MRADLHEDLNSARRQRRVLDTAGMTSGRTERSWGPVPIWNDRAAAVLVTRAARENHKSEWALPSMIKL